MQVGFHPQGANRQHLLAPDSACAATLVQRGITTIQVPAEGGEGQGDISQATSHKLNDGGAQQAAQVMVGTQTILWKSAVDVVDVLCQHTILYPKPPSIGQRASKGGDPPQKTIHTQLPHHASDGGGAAKLWSCGTPPSSAISRAIPFDADL